MNFLLAAVDNGPSRIEELGHYFSEAKRSTATLPWGYWLIGLVVLGVVIGATIAFVHWWTRRTYDNPHHLFRQLCQLHALDRQQQSLLKDLAAVNRVGQPSELFLDPSYFDKQLPESLSKHQTSIQAIRKRVFAA